MALRTSQVSSGAVPEVAAILRLSANHQSAGSVHAPASHPANDGAIIPSMAPPLTRKWASFGD